MNYGSGELASQFTIHHHSHARPVDCGVIRSLRHSLIDSLKSQLSQSLITRSRSQSHPLKVRLELNLSESIDELIKN